MLLLVIGLCLGLGLRLGPTRLMVSRGVQEGEPSVNCAQQQTHAGKLLVHLLQGHNLGGSGAVSAYGKLRIGGVLKDSRFSRIGWQTKVNLPTHHNDASPDWQNDGRRWFCLDTPTLAHIMGHGGGKRVGEADLNKAQSGGVLLEMWHYKYWPWLRDELLGTVDLSAVVNRAVAEFGDTRLHSETLVLKDVAGADRGILEVGAQWFPNVELESVLPALQSGDVLLFAGDTHTGRMVQAFTDSEWSHTALVSARTGLETTVIEASTNRAGLMDCDDQEVHVGVERLGLLDKVYSGFYRSVSVRLLVFKGERVSLSPLTGEILRHNTSVSAVNGAGASGKERAGVEAKLEDFYERQRRKPYEHFSKEMVGRRIKDGEWGDRETFFCSEFTAAAYLDAGVWNSEQVASNVMPRDFTSGETAMQSLMSGIAHLTTEVYFRRTQRFPKGRCYEEPGLCQCGGRQHTAYSSTMACWQGRECHSVLQLWFGSGWDGGLGLDVELILVVVCILWLSACCMGNTFVLASYRLRLGQVPSGANESGKHACQFKKVTPLDYSNAVESADRGEALAATQDTRSHSERDPEVETDAIM